MTDKHSGRPASCSPDIRTDKVLSYRPLVQDYPITFPVNNLWRSLMKEKIHDRITGRPKAIGAYIEKIQRVDGLEVVEKSKLIRNRNSRFSRCYLTINVIEQEDKHEDERTSAIPKSSV